MEIVNTDFILYSADKEEYIKNFINKDNKKIKISFWSIHPYGTQIKLELSRKQAETLNNLMMFYGWESIYTMFFHRYRNKIKIDNISYARCQEY